MPKRKRSQVAIIFSLSCHSNKVSLGDSLSANTADAENEDNDMAEFIEGSKISLITVAQLRRYKGGQSDKPYKIFQSVRIRNVIINVDLKRLRFESKVR